MLTTKQVRTIIRKHMSDAGGGYNPIWTNRWRDDNVRSVKVYNLGNNDKLIAELKKKGGAGNVHITEAREYSSYAGGIVVRCTLG